MKLEPVTKPEKENKAALKTFGDKVMPINCAVIVLFPIYGQFGAIQKPDFRCIVRFHNLHFH